MKPRGGRCPAETAFGTHFGVPSPACPTAGSPAQPQGLPAAGDCSGSSGPPLVQGPWGPSPPLPAAALVEGFRICGALPGQSLIS